MQPPRSSKLTAGVSINLITCASTFAAIFSFDRYSVSIKSAFMPAIVVGVVLQVWGAIEQERLSHFATEEAAIL